MSIDRESLIVWNNVKLKFFFFGLSWNNAILDVMGDSMEIHSPKYNHLIQGLIIGKSLQLYKLLMN